MARYAIISDLHGNIQALEAVLADIEQQGADGLICLGDLVGYGANPVEVIDTVRGTKINGVETVVLRGNHDDALLNPQMMHGLFNNAAQDSIHYALNTLHRLGADRYLPISDWFSNLPIKHEENY